MSRVGGIAGTALGGLRRRLPPRLSGLVDRLADRDILLAGSSLAFYGLVSLLPLLLIAFALVGNVAGQETLTRFTRETAQSGSAAIGSFVGQLADSSSSLSWVAVIAGLWPATAYGGGLRRALSHATAGDEELPGLRGRVLGLSLVLVLPVLMLTGVPLTFVLVRLGGSGLVGTLLGWGGALAAAVTVGTVTTTLLYHAFAPEDLGFRRSIAAAGLVSVVTAFFTLGFVLYLRLGQVEERFGGGTIAAVVLMGLWLFVANVLLLAGYHGMLGEEHA